MQIFKDLEQNIGLFEKKLPIQKSFDLVGRRLITVSYTHLDVYKRQQLHRAAHSQWWDWV